MFSNTRSPSPPARKSRLVSFETYSQQPDYTFDIFYVWKDNARLMKIRSLIVVAAGLLAGATSQADTVHSIKISGAITVQISPSVASVIPISNESIIKGVIAVSGTAGAATKPSQLDVVVNEAGTSFGVVYKGDAANPASLVYTLGTTGTATMLYGVTQNAVPAKKPKTGIVSGVQTDTLFSLPYFVKGNDVAQITYPYVVISERLSASVSTMAFSKASGLFIGGTPSGDSPQVFIQGVYRTGKKTYDDIEFPQ